MNHSTRCAGCKYLRRRCPSDCILSPYFPPNNPQRFYYVHKIYGASNVTKILQQVPVHQRAEAANAMYYEAYCRIKDPVYGCVGIITLLHQQIYEAQLELSQIQADQIAVLNGLHAQQDQFPSEEFGSNYSFPGYPSVGHGSFSSSTFEPSTPPFY
ncbi:OLC1v1032271C1 [Oldenlandia corymbosa var. corymbosa]|uniref:OLC1v1032271C1 n=1 Tax=Oldenlandia corymbosa var. corymbosa TaxID=529605 RepID=A0AAV1CLA5_OLDCO|nr:OLC1v1032271C1 [Oldenlandia corymbosa var. corymbosa]